MAQTSEEAAKAPQREIIKLNVISPNSPSVTLIDVPISTTIDALKQTIYEASPSHPPVTSQRLIYRGHPVIQGEKTLREVFTESIVSSRRSHTLTLLIAKR